MYLVDAIVNCMELKEPLGRIPPILNNILKLKVSRIEP
jgi:hypothetical protein